MQSSFLRGAVGRDIRHQRALGPIKADGLGDRRRDFLHRHADIGAGDLAVRHNLVHHFAGQIHRHRETNALIATGAGRQNGRIDADQLTAVVHKRAAGIARIDGGIRLDEVFVVFNAHVRPACGADDSHGDGLSDSIRIADRQNFIAHLQFRRVADGDCRQVRGVDLDHRDIGLGVGADDLGFEFAAVGKSDADVRGAVDYVIVRENVAIGTDNDARTEAAFTMGLRRLGCTALPSTAAEELAKQIGFVTLPELAHAGRGFHHLRSRNFDDCRHGGLGRRGHGQTRGALIGVRQFQVDVSGVDAGMSRDQTPAKQHHSGRGLQPRFGCV